MPASRIRSSVSRSSAVVALTHVKWAIASRPKSSLMPATMSIVLARCSSEPPAP